MHIRLQSYHNIIVSLFSLIVDSRHSMAAPKSAVQKENFLVLQTYIISRIQVPNAYL